MGSFFGIEIGKRAVMTQQTGLNITGHNIANANTPGYARQVADIETTSPWHAPMLNNSSRVGQLGTGVDVTSINRIRDEFVDAQIRKETQTFGYWDSMQETLSRVEAILNEPSEDGLRGVMDVFWESWQELSLNPESESVRSVVMERGMALAEAFNHTYSQLNDLKIDLNDQVKIKSEEINSIAKQIADLNKQIMAIVCAGKQPNDLQDKRDLLLAELSQIADVDVSNDKNGMIAVQLGDRMLVQGVDYNKIDLKKDDQGMYMLVWNDSQTRVKIDNGELQALLDARGKTSLEQEAEPSEYKETIPKMIDDLNTLAKTIITKINEIHRGGYSLNNKTGVPDGNNFFNMPGNPDTFANWASFMSVSASIQKDVKNITAAARRTWDAAGNKSNFGDGDNALKIAQLKQSLNSPQFSVKTEGLNIDFSSHNPLTFCMDDGDGPVEISIAPPYTFEDMERLAEALQTEMQKNNIDAQVRCEGGEIVFYSTTTRALEIIYPDSGITDLAMRGLQNGEYQVRTEIKSLGIQSATLNILQNYNQKTAGSIFGSGILGNASSVKNASIELTVSKVDSFTGEVSYSYVSHEYDLDGNYELKTGGFTLKYGGAATQTITIGSLTASITGLDQRSGADVSELKVGDKGILGLTAATTGGTYQQVDINYDFNSPGEVSQRFVFNETTLDSTTTRLHFFTLNNNEQSNLCGESFDGYIELTTDGALETSDPAAYFSYYEGFSKDSGMVENATTDDFWRSITANTGVESQEARRMVVNQDILLGELEKKWESVSGVSLDEEMSNMIMFQHAYNAAARFITSIDEGLETIINRMGLVGR